MRVVRLDPYVAIASLLALGFAFFFAACTPQQVETAQRRIVPAVKAACVLIRAFTSEGDVKEACATVDELAPLLGQILAAREEPASAAAPRPEDVEAVAVLPTPRRKVPLRRCKVWEPLASLKDAGRAERPGDAAGDDGGAGESGVRSGHRGP